MPRFDPYATARAIQGIRRQRAPLDPLPAELAPATDHQGAAVQRALAELTGALPPQGFKIGATGRRMQSYLGVDAPVAGFMHPRDVHPGGAVLRFADFLNPGVECEVAVRLRSDLPFGACTPEQAKAAVGEVFAGIEIVENRYGDLQALGTPTLLADGMYHAAAVIGDTGTGNEAVPDLGSLSGSITSDDGRTDTGAASDLLGDPLNCLAWLAGSITAAAFGGLKRGQVVMLGSVTPPLWLDGPATVTVSFPPLPGVAVRLS